MQQIVGIGEMKISNNQTDTIKTFALASCVGIVAYSSQKKIGGILHIALPNSHTQGIAEMRTYYYADTGFPAFIREMSSKYGCRESEIGIRLYGGASSINPQDVFHVGANNIQMVKTIAARMNLMILEEELGGNISRTIELDISTGNVKIWRQKIII